MSMPKMTVISPTPELADQINHDTWVSIPKKALRKAFNGLIGVLEKEIKGMC